MATPARVSTLMYCKLQATDSGCKQRSDTKPTSKSSRRRELLLLSTVTATALVGDTRTDLLNKYLKKSQENKAKNDKERQDSYYKRNYIDYFNLLEGDLKQKQNLSESEKGILDWLEKNK